MIDAQQCIVCFRLASEFLVPRDACRLMLLNKYFSRHYLNEAFKEAIASQVIAQLPEEIEIQTDVTFSQLLYMLHGFKNLLQNPCGHEGFSHWTKQDGGNGWVIEDWPDFRGNKSAFISSYEWCSLSQTIDLLKKGYSKKALSNAVIVAGAIICARADCGALGKVEIFAGPGMESRMSTEEVRCPEDGLVGFSFRPVTISIVKNLPDRGTALKYVALGKDTKWWAGQYGARFLHTFLYVIPIPDGKRHEEMFKIKTEPMARPE